MPHRRRPVSLEQIRIPSPCPVPWETMRGGARVRHCDHCDLHVHNLSAMTREEGESFVSGADGRCCVAYEPTVDGAPRPLQYERASGRRRFGWRSVVLVGSLGAMLAGSLQHLLARAGVVPPPPPTAPVRGRPMMTAGAISMESLLRDYVPSPEAAADSPDPEPAMETSAADFPADDPIH